VAGFSTIGAPTASAGAILCATRFTGKLNGEMPRTGPNANRRKIAARPSMPASASSRRNSPPVRDRVSSAAQRNVATARVASIFDHFSGLPPSRAIDSANSSTRSAIRLEMCMSASALALIVSSRDCSNASTAFVTASSTSSSVGIPSSATTLWSYGLLTWNVSWPVRHEPAT
jgi:hypothetical protein